MRIQLAALCGFLLASTARAQSYGPWHVLGRFDFDSAKASIADVLGPDKLSKAMLSGDSGPDLAATYKGMAGETLAWVKLGAALEVDALDVGALDLNAVCAPPTSKKNDVGNAVCFLYRRIDCESAVELPVQMGSDDGLRVWLNGTLIVDANVARALALEDHFERLKLRAGANHLFVKVSQFGGPFQFQIRPWTKLAQSAVNASIDRGVQFLIRRQLIDGSWSVWNEYGGGHAALTAYTLLKCGVSNKHPAVRMALAYTKAHPIDSVYSLSCLILALEAGNDPEERGRLEDAVAQLLDMQTSVGLFDYGNRDLPMDMSNTLYAALALRAAHKAKVDVPDGAWAKLAAGTLRCLAKDQKVAGPDGYERTIAGFTYRAGEGGATGSMTTAGVSVLAMCDEMLGERLTGALRARCDTAKKHGLGWIEHNMTWSTNPGAGIGHHYFWVYGLERVGALLALERFGDIDWYWDGAAYLVSHQGGDGSWNPEGYVDHQYLDTQLALLFLKRATMRVTGETTRTDVFETQDVKAAVRLRATGDTPLTLWVSALSDKLVTEYAAADATLDIAEIEYFARLEGDTNAPVLIGRCAGLQAKRDELQRFAVRHAFDRNGRWLISARLHVRPAPVEGVPLGEARGIDSPELAIDIDGVMDPARLSYAADINFDLLNGAKTKIEASSNHIDAETPERATDGDYATRWRCNKDDTTPWIRVTAERPIKADKLLLTHALARMDEALSPRVLRVDVVVNQKDHFPMTLGDNALAKSIVAFGQTLAIKELEVRVLDCTNRKPGVDPVGFSEIELQKSR